MADPLVTEYERQHKAAFDRKLASVLSAGRPTATIKQSELTNRERLAQALAGDSKPGSLRRHLVDRTIGGMGSNGTAAIDFTPASVLFADEAAKRVGTPGQRLGGLIELGAMAIPIPAAKAGAKGIKKGLGRMAEDLLTTKQTASLTAEQVPYGASGYNIAERPFAQRRAYTEAAPWTSAQGGDRLSQALGYETKPTQQGSGYWQPPDGPPEINPTQVHRPQFTPQPDGTVPPHDAAAFDFMQAYRGLNDVQAGTPWHALGGAAEAPASRYSLDLGRQPTSDEMARFSEAMPADAGVWNASEGVTFAQGFDAISPQIDDAVRSVAPAAHPRQDAGGNYLDLGSELESPGQGLATNKVLEFQRAMSPEQQAAISDPSGPFQQLSMDAGLMRGERARQFGVEGVRPDFDHLWKLQAEGGWNRVMQWVDQNGSKGLPVLAGWLALHEAQTPPQK